MAKKASTPKKAPAAAHDAEERKKILMNWFLVIIMVGSVGIALVSNSNAPKPTDQQEPPALKEAPTIIPFVAEDVNATVEDIFGAMIVTASTTQPDITQIDAQLLGITGVSRVNSQFKELKDASKGPQPLSYFAEVVYAKEIAASKLLSDIQKQATYLSEVAIYPIGLVSLPDTLSLVNADLNLFKEYPLKDAFKLSQAFLTVDTRKGDTVLVHVEADLAGDRIQRMMVYESQNPSNAPLILELTGTYAIAGLVKNLAVLGKLPYSSSPPDANALQKEALNVEAMVAGEVQFENPPLVLQVLVPAGFSAKSSDLNRMLYQVTGVRRVRFHEDEGKVFLDFLNTANYDGLKKDVQNVFAAAGFKQEQLTFTDPDIRVTGVFDASTNELAAVSQKLVALFKKYGVAVDSFQPATIQAEKLVDPKTGNEYAIADGSFQALVKPGHKEKDLVGLGIQFVGKRDRAEKIQAIEGQPGEDQTIPITAKN